MTARSIVTAIGLAATLSTMPALAGGQALQASPRPPELVHSMGQPPLVKPYLGGSFTWNREGEDRTGGVGVLGLYKDLVLPVSGAFGLSAEGYLGGSGGEWDGGGRVFATSRLLFLNAGVDWNARTGKADFILAFTPYFKRGGLLGTGGNFRIEWIPGRHHSFNLGFQIPLEPHMGKTRPVATDVRLPKPPRPAARATVPPEVEAALLDLDHSGYWLVVHANFFNDDDDASYFKAMQRFRGAVARAKALFDETDARHPGGRTYASESRHYHDALDRAFTAAVGAEHGRAVSDMAREIVLDDVLLPYDRLFGRFKKDDTLLGFAARGRQRLAQALEECVDDGDRRQAALTVYDSWIGRLERGRAGTLEHWERDERKVWLPLDLALRPEQHDSQQDLDAIVARALGRPFTRGNAVFPTTASRFQIELLRSIRAAQDYHVLWIHDYAGRVDGKPDTIAHAVAVEGYLETLTERVREYDRTGRLPVFLIFHTQFFYEGSGSRLFLSLLEDPLHHELNLGEGFPQMEQTVRAAQAELRQAVAASPRLQAEARERGGDGWLRKVVKVHVNVTFPADMSFRTPKIVDLLPFAPDSLMLDHRKLFFYDVTEEDPGRGEALFTGTGVGQEYAGPTWDDRGLLVSGPALLELKAAARRLLLSQGFHEDEIPQPLRPLARPDDYDARVAGREAEGFFARGLVANNEVGFASKEATVVQAILYTLAPADTVIVVPDSIWASPTWAGQLAGAALRGCHVYVIAPSQDNAPAAGLPVLARTREVFARLFELSREMADEIAASGGHLRVGLYTRSSPSGDTLKALREVAAGLRRYPFLIEEFPMPVNIVGILDERAAQLEADGFEPQFISEGTRAGRPKMHRKTQLFVTKRALRSLADEPEAEGALRRAIDVVAFDSAHALELLKQTPLRPGGVLAHRYVEDPPAAARDALYYLTVGSKNQDPRGAFLDGEIAVVIAGPWGLAYYGDFIALMADTTWIEREGQLEELISVDEEKARRLGRRIRNVL